MKYLSVGVLRGSIGNTGQLPILMIDMLILISPVAEPICTVAGQLPKGLEPTTVIHGRRDLSLPAEPGSGLASVAPKKIANLEGCTQISDTHFWQFSRFVTFGINYLGMGQEAPYPWLKHEHFGGGHPAEAKCKVL